MLTIRDAQLEVLRCANVCGWIVRYLESCYPLQTARLGRAALYRFAELAAERARSRHFNDDQEVRKYVHISFVLGSDFETRSDCQWAAKILNNPDYHDASAQLRAVEDEMAVYLKAKAMCETRGGGL